MTYSANAKSSGGHEGLAHVVPVPVLLTVFALLMVLTVVTLSVTRIDLGSWNLWIAMGIATVKAALVALYFMHLRYDPLFHALIFLTALVFLALFLSLTLLDTLEYQPAIKTLQESRPK
jgi:cytochrome c oxidase subunit 4